MSRIVTYYTNMSWFSGWVDSCGSVVKGRRSPPSQWLPGSQDHIYWGNNLTGCIHTWGFLWRLELPRICQHLFGAFFRFLHSLLCSGTRFPGHFYWGDNLTAFSGSRLLGSLDRSLSTLGVSSGGRDCRVYRTNDVPRGIGLLLLPPSLARANLDDSITSNCNTDPTQHGMIL